MTCTCSAKALDRAAFCFLCPHGGSARENVVACSIDGKPLVGRTKCAAGCFGDGWIEWLGVRWYGVPIPLRWLLRVRVKVPLSGCGCVVRLKDVWTRIKERGWLWQSQRERNDRA